MRTATPPSAPRDLLAWLWLGYMRPFRGLLILSIVLMALEGLSLAVLALIIEPMFDDVFMGGSHRALLLVSFGVLGLFLIRAVTSLGHGCWGCS